jgi:CrcB protein
MLQSSLWISLGAVLGANARYWLGLWLAQQVNTRFPLPTFLINVSGSFLLGLLAGYTQSRPNPSLALFFGVGFCGSFTTFSTFSVEILTLWRNGDGWLALAYIVASLLFGFLGAWLGMRWGMP